MDPLRPAGSVEPPPARAEPRDLFSAPAFAAHIDGYVVPDHAALDAALLEAIAAWRAESAGVKISNYKGWHSTRDLFNRPEPAFARLLDHVRTATARSIRRYWPEFDPSRHTARCHGWVNVNGPGAFNVPHAHNGNHLSGSYYVTTPPDDGERGGAIEFLNPLGAVSSPGPFGQRLVPPDFRVQPKAGQMVIFPAYLRHWVYPHHAEEERVSIAFNVMLGGG